jgi:3'(2'), 5'-bisphosphate nucleotidase
MRPDLEYLLKCARKAALLGAQKISGIYELYLSGGDIGIKEKGKNDPVTAADMAANQVIMQTLRSYLPDHDILSEEEPSTWNKTGEEWVWMIDPLDGTKDFIKRNGEFVTMIGLTHFGEPIIGVVIEPARGLEFYGCKGHGAFSTVYPHQGVPVPLRFTDTVDPDHLRLAVSRSHRNSKVDKLIQLLEIAEEIPSGSVGRKMAMVINGNADMYVHPARGTKLWDTCACDVIASEAGGILLSGTGDKISYVRASGDIENHYGLLLCSSAIADKVTWASRKVWGLDEGKDQ